MARETRGSAARQSPDEGLSTPSKRKRLSSTTTTPAPPSIASLKVTLPSPFTHESTVEKSDDAGAYNHESKRQRIHLKVNGSKANGDSRTRSMSKSPATEEGTITAVNHEDAKPEGHILSPEVREALAVVISQMAVNLPAPLHGVLTLWLPPDFAKKEENTLGFVLRQGSLTWESLVDLLHMFAENLLVPCSYPNPMPSLPQLHQPIPPLPSHFRPHVIYDFCAALHHLMLNIEPGQEPHLDRKPTERWALMQKLPSNQGGIVKTSEWFTSTIDTRAIDAGLKKIEKEGGKVEETLLETLASTGDKFGLATAVAVQSSIGSSASQTAPRLSDSLIKKASLKTAQWKEIQAKRKGYFGSISRGVQPPLTGSTSWTPGFAPLFDSSSSTGSGSYYSTLDAMHERARHRQWGRRALSRSYQPALDPEEGWFGTLDLNDGKDHGDSVSVGPPKRQGKSKNTADQALGENMRWIEELQAWQNIRVRKGEVDMVSEREQLVAHALLSSLTDLADNTNPSDLISTYSGNDLAHQWSRRTLPIASPVIRGTLDPRRPRAVHDSATVRPRSAVTQNINGSTVSNPSSPHRTPDAYNPQISGSSSPQVFRNYPPPQSSGPRQPLYHASNPSYRPPPTPVYNQYNPPPAGNTIYGRTGAPNQPINSPTVPSSSSTYVRPGPGPSGLRQSFGPGVPPLKGSTIGANHPASGFMSQVGGNYQPRATP